MKGLAHFVSGIAAASFLPEAVRMSAGGGYPLLLAGIGALLPDVLDFRLARFLQRPDLELRVDAERPDPQAMAESICAAVDRAIEVRRPVILRLPTARTGSGLWRQYTVFLRREVKVRIGPLVSTSGGLARSSVADGAEATVRPSQALELDYGCAVQVDAFAGPTIALERVPGGVRAIYLPWHRVWSHSLLLAAALALGVAAMWRPLYGILIGMGAVAHIAGDQLGHMGSNLLWPVTRHRTRGVGLFHSGEMLPNVLTTLLGVLLLVYNLARVSNGGGDQAWALLGTGAVLLTAVLASALRWGRRQRLPGASEQQVLVGEDLRGEGDAEFG